MSIPLLSGKLKRRYAEASMWKQCTCELYPTKLLILSFDGKQVEKEIPINGLTEIHFEESPDSRVFTLGIDKNVCSFQVENIEKLQEWKKMIKYLTFKRNKYSIKDFVVEKELGAGFFGHVLLVRHKQTKKLYALKCLSKKFLINEDQEDSAKTERDVLIMARHPFVVKICFAFQDSSQLYIGLEYISGRYLFRLIQEEYSITLPELRFYVAEISLGLEHLHSQGIIYRDLKLENVLVCKNGHIKLSDFGLAKKLLNYKGELTKTDTFCGIDEYIAPEMILGKPYGFELDWWCLGILMYELCFHETPFVGKNGKETYDRIMKEEPYFPAAMPEMPKNLIKLLLNKNPAKRANFETIRNHEMFKGVDWEMVQQKKYDAIYLPPQTKLKPKKAKPLKSERRLTMVMENDAFENFTFCGEL
ncbi:AGC family protein kinase [Trichomonas vaginalis G3]|uniref:AGC family protein kinase n=1 Tax=Trichomonas vaginalis (strain ATCC PRA-98 / G3) TaxID=412133 RepID=A2FY70_TRIV3|nr:protein kinase C protein [Trichomonas vaginalis G3]EAX90148.1 AGC family protein kinase [Trichomonas vaginalis G3]KAI5550118.1 protein kinase C protein [Trichomonas vaginalis G3]|eukprot:XP_001303078.1 AGC family protein kinase [Trichomonas vaginalis G3]